MMYPSQMTGGNSSVLVKEPEIGEVLGKLKPNHACSCLNQSAMNDQSAMCEFHEQLRQLARETCQHPPGSLERRRGLTKIIREIQRSGRLWQENTPYYEDALQETWKYLCRNLCEANTGRRYDPEQATLVTWLNKYLKWRLHDYLMKQKEEEARKYSPNNQEEGNNTDPLNNLPAQPDVPPIQEEARRWAETDPDGKLRCTCHRRHPEINCQVLILARLSLPQPSWKELAEEFNNVVDKSTLNRFFDNKCKPCLREFGKSKNNL